MQVTARTLTSPSVSCMTRRRFASRSAGVKGVAARNKGIAFTVDVCPPLSLIWRAGYGKRRCWFRKGDVPCRDGTFSNLLPLWLLFSLCARRLLPPHRGRFPAAHLDVPANPCP